MYEYFDKKIATKSDDITLLYNEGYVFTRIGVGVMHKIKGLRVNISKFELSSENRRILRKEASVKCIVKKLPYSNYTYSIQKMGASFYAEKFGKGVFSAYKIAEIFTKQDNLNFNYVFEFRKDNKSVGFAISFMNKDIIHYSYPFYDLDLNDRDLGLGMMSKVLEYAKDHDIKYVYLGSVYKKESLYKLQFRGGEWFDGYKWRDDLNTLKLQFR
ncbi:GNAT family N-acetyltransferase [Patescibacteria group bacterium]|nr:GNAT family N-acetyltransferase [Patescibacteria group bacterium]